MQIEILTLFPELFQSFLDHALVSRAQSRSLVSFSLTNPRAFAKGNYQSVDDTPYGGGSGMVLKPEPLVSALEAIQDARFSQGVNLHKILLTPRGRLFTHADAIRLARYPALCFVCGRYEGIDQRVANFVDEELSIGDFILAGGEVAAMCIIEATLRFLPNVLGNPASLDEESHTAVGVEYPQYTRPPVFRGYAVPEVLMSGNHSAVAAWRQSAARYRTQDYRPDLHAQSKKDA